MKTPIFSKTLLIIVLCGIFLSCKQKPEDPSVVHSSKYKKTILEEYHKLGLFCSTNMIPGLTIAVSIDNQLIWADGFGFSNQELKVKTSPSHKFRIGQITQIITSLTAAKLFEEGKLIIDKPVGEYLPELSNKKVDFTIRQLAANSGGLRVDSVPAGQGPGSSIKEKVLSFMNYDLLYEPGTNFLGTEQGFDMIGYVLEKTRNKSFNKVAKETILDTLKLTNTVPDIYFWITNERSSTYEYNFVAEPINANQIDLRGKEASAGYLSSVLDLVKIGNTILYPGFLKKQTIDLLITPFKLKNGQEIQSGFGLIVSKDRKDRLFYGQKGFVKGGCSALLIYPEDKLVIAIAANIKSESWELPVFDISENFLNQLHPEKQEPVQEKK
jgi:serine beta-lactamase-like protein LACTB, mitochondrial